MAARRGRQRISVDRRPSDAQQHLRVLVGAEYIGPNGCTSFGNLQRLGNRQLASPSAVAVNSTKLVASPARSLETSSSAAVPKAMTTALSCAGSTSGVWASTAPAKARPGSVAAGSDSGVLRAGTPTVAPYLPLHVASSAR